MVDTFTARAENQYQTGVTNCETNNALLCKEAGVLTVLCVVISGFPVAVLLFS